MLTKFSQFIFGGALQPGDRVVGLRGGINTQFLAAGLGTLPYVVLTVAQPLVANTAYSMANAIAAIYTLPLLADAGDIIEISSNTLATFTIAQNAGQQIQFGNLTTTVGVIGSIGSLSIGDSVVLQCEVANTMFTVLGAPQGIWSVI